MMKDTYMDIDELEIWREVPRYGRMYEVSNHGRIKSKERTVRKRNQHGGISLQTYREKILKPSDSKGYKRVHISVDGLKHKVFVHTMVLLAFHGEPSAGDVCRHLNGDPSDNRPENLAWGSHLENMIDRKLHGKYPVGQYHHQSKLTNKQRDEIANCSLKLRDIVEIYGISMTSASRIRRNWIATKTVLALLV